MNPATTSAPAGRPKIVYVILHGRYPVPEDLLDCARAQLDRPWWSLKAGQQYTARQLCGPRFWGDLAAEERRLIGSCISHLVKQRELPLFLCDKAAPGRPNTYSLRA